MKINMPALLTGGLVGITTCTGLVLSSVTTFADNDSATDEVNITVPVACTMTSTITTGQEHTATLQPGTYSGASGSGYENGIGKTTLATFCNDYNGFSIYAIGFTGETEGDNTLVGTSASGGATIPTKVYESTDTTSNWSMKVTKVTDSSTTFNPANMTITNSFDSWHNVPDDYTKVAEYHASTGSSATDQSLGAKVETTYASYISTSQPADTYTGKVKYVMVHPYDATAPVISTASACNTPVPNLTYMQDLNSTNKATVLASMTEDAQYFLKDKRDEKSYCVAKLKDGNIWMTQNLDHDIVTTPNYYTNENTDIGWNSSTGSYDTASWTPDKATYATNDTTWTKNPSLAGYTIQESYDPGDLYPSEDAINGQKYYYSCDAGSCDTTIYAELNSEWKAYFDSCDTGTVNNCDNSLRPSNNTSSEGIDQYHLGNYYNWTAAIAMNDSSSYTTDNTDVNQSICPANWTLAKAGNNISNGSFYYLLNQYGTWNSETWHMDNGYNPTETPIYLAPSGRWYGSLELVGGYGNFWSSVVVHSYSAYGYLAAVGGYVNPGINYYNRNNGGSVRCLAR